MAYTRARTYQSRIKSVCMGEEYRGAAQELVRKYDELARMEKDPVKREMYMNYRENYVRDDGCYTN